MFICQKLKNFHLPRVHPLGAYSSSIFFTSNMSHYLKSLKICPAAVPHACKESNGCVADGRLYMILHFTFIFLVICLSVMGGDLGGLGGRPPKKFEVGDGPCIRPLQFLRSTVMGCEAKYELTKRCQGGIFLSEIEVFCQEKGIIYVINQISDKIESKKVIRNFFIKRSFEYFRRPPPKSAPGLCQC